ncbi:MAG: GFA family protein, partial [Patescibacteria group bacterium]
MTKYTGGCHCGAVKYEVEADLSEVMDCNCSHCAKKGFLLAFVPADQFQLLSGEESLTEYRFNKKAIAHLFCSICGVQSFGRGSGPDGKEVVALNARCLDGIDMSTLTIKHVDGK